MHLIHVLHFLNKKIIFIESLFFSEKAYVPLQIIVTCIVSEINYLIEASLFLHLINCIREIVSNSPVIFY